MADFFQGPQLFNRKKPLDQLCNCSYLENLNKKQGTPFDSNSELGKIRYAQKKTGQALQKANPIFP